MALELAVSGFATGEAIPRRHTCEGEDISPAMSWTGAPGGTRSFVLIVDDPDAPASTWNHWLLYDIPPSTCSLPEASRPGQTGRAGYGGPCPPRGRGPHRYFFKLFALQTASLGLPPGARRADLDAALGPHVLAEAHYLGRYERK